MLKLLVFLLLSFSLFSKTVELKMKALWKKGNITQERETKILAKIDQEWSIPCDGNDSFKYNMKVTNDVNISKQLLRTDVLKPDVMISGKISVLDSGNERVIATPMILSYYNTEAVLTMESKDGEYFELKITPTEKTSLP